LVELVAPGEGLFAKVNFKKGNLIFTWEGGIEKR